MREITKADKEGYAGFATKSTNDCCHYNYCAVYDSC